MTVNAQHRICVASHDALIAVMRKTGVSSQATSADANSMYGEGVIHADICKAGGTRINHHRRRVNQLAILNKRRASLQFHTSREERRYALKREDDENATAAREHWRYRRNER